ncbi:sensor histidine kinase [Alteraurantiacibacter aquimixticola]|uniref:histidine kinase n=1 Tax=Alteraurantiacibacter aquimixticola TaxID=2489173 RepID=A0A4T3EWJ0_9SPHN|nr:ATP-binding protein [Alteraurantiacibacter aquimixticola]TIX48925.1 two-component sensor histidine kinase [Alteraurantiacibacter aquimixticola]
MRRFLPKSLLGQMLLAVALALLAAQTLSGILRFRAEELRRENGLINTLAFQLVADPRVEYRFRDGRDHNRRERRRLRIERALESPVLRGEFTDPERLERLTDVLTDQGVAIDDLVVLSRPVSRDDYIMRGLKRIRTDSQIANRDGWDVEGDMLIAGLKRVGEEEWLVARVPLPGPEHGRYIGIIIQTLLIYVILVGGLYWLLRRITRPLAALRTRMETFGNTRETAGQLEPSGPEDTRQLITAHNAMEARIAALLDEKDVMLGAIGHDLKTPLAALRVRIESVEDDAERLKMARTIEDITNSLDDILSLARVGRPSDPLERTELSALVASVVEEYEDMGEDVTLGETQRTALRLRATWLRRALRNLIGNALRYGEKPVVSLARENGEAVIRIEDEGPGIPDGDIMSMLEPFKRGEASRNRETGGAGLGLTLARAIAEQHGGTLTLANRLGDAGTVVGLVATIRLPLDS